MTISNEIFVDNRNIENLHNLNHSFAIRINLDDDSFCIANFNF